MGVLRDTIDGVKPLIYVGWIVAAARLAIEAATTDLNVVAMFSVYAAVAVMLLFAGFTGLLDRLVWKRLLLASVVLGVACWSIPNAIVYSIAQFRGWSHGRFYVDPEHNAIQQRLMKEGMGYFDSAEKAEQELGRKSQTRGPPIADTPAGKIKAALMVSFFTAIAGTLWTLVLGALFVGIPATVRRRRTA